MKAVVLNGAESGDHASHTVYEIIASALEDIGWQVEPCILHEIKIASCRGCFGCWVKTPGICVIDDAGHDVARMVIQSDLVVLLTPVTFGGYSSELKKALDRIICLISPFFVKIGEEVHHKPRYERYPRLVGVGVLPHPDGESERVFKTLVGRNAINLHCPAHAGGVVLSTQGPDEMRETIQTLLTTAEV